jgi:hypothetical protein
VFRFPAGTDDGANRKTLSEIDYQSHGRKKELRLRQKVISIIIIILTILKVPL